MHTSTLSTKVLNAVCQHLRIGLESGFVRLSVTNNPRADSTLNQQVIFDALRGFAARHTLFIRHKLTIEIPVQPKHWCDIKIHGPRGFFLPINLKISTCLNNDDLNSKEGMFYALTGQHPESVNIKSWPDFFKELSRHIKPSGCDADYFYLIVEKPSAVKVMGDVFWTSLLKLRSVAPNGNCLPFQCRWKDNRQTSDRTREEAIRYLSHSLGQSLELQTRPYEAYRRHFLDQCELLTPAFS